MTVTPNIVNKEKWRRHFENMADGKIAPINKIYAVGRENRTQTGGSQEDRVKIVSPTAQAVEMAKAEVEREIAPEEAGGTQRGIKRRAPMRGGRSAKRHRRVQTNKKKRKGKKKRKQRAAKHRARGNSRKGKSLTKKVRRDLLGIY